MRKLAVTLSLAVLLVLAIPVLTLAKPAHTPHEDPSLTRTAPDLAVLLTFYGNSVAAAALGKYADGW